MNSQILLQIQIFANNGPGERVLLYGLSLPAYYSPFVGSQGKKE